MLKKGHIYQIAWRDSAGDLLLKLYLNSREVYTPKNDFILKHSNAVKIELYTEAGK